MINLSFNLLSACDLGLFPLLLGLLLPFLLGLLLGWLLWSRFKSMVANLETKLDATERERDDWKMQSDGYRKQVSEIEGDISTAQGRAREMEVKVSDMESKLADCESALTKAKAAGGSNTTSNISNAGAAVTGAALGSQLRSDDKGGSDDSSSSATGGVVGAGAAVKEDLTKIEGIGPKTKELLYAAGIYNFAQLSDTKASRVQEILNEAGDRFKLINPGTWARQAGMADRGEWDTLDKYQDWLIGGIEPEGQTFDPNASASDSSASNEPAGKLDEAKSVFGKAIKLNDLTVVEGIGPKTASVLAAADVNGWWDLANIDLVKLQGILTAAELPLAVPDTWPKQSMMAFEGKWKELLEYQDWLDGGKEPT